MSNNYSFFPQKETVFNNKINSEKIFILAGELGDYTKLLDADLERTKKFIQSFYDPTEYPYRKTVPTCNNYRWITKKGFSWNDPNDVIPAFECVGMYAQEPRGFRESFWIRPKRREFYFTEDQARFFKYIYETYVLHEWADPDEYGKEIVGPGRWVGVLDYKGSIESNGAEGPCLVNEVYPSNDLKSDLDDYRVRIRQSDEVVNVHYLCGGIATGKTSIMRGLDSFDNEVSVLFRVRFERSDDFLPDKYIPIFLVLGLCLKIHSHFKKCSDLSNIIVNRSYLDHEFFSFIRDEGACSLNKRFFNNFFSSLSTRENINHYFYVPRVLAHSDEIEDYSFGWPLAEYRELESFHFPTRESLLQFNFHHIQYIKDNFIFKYNYCTCDLDVKNTCKCENRLPFLMNENKKLRNKLNELLNMNI